MTTRAGSAAISQHVKQKLVNLLFKSDCTRKGPEAHRKLDVASYTYVDLRDAYLKRIHLIHPDKCIQSLDNETKYTIKSVGSVTSKSTWNDDIQWRDIASVSKKNNRHDEFIELQDAWKAYETLMKHMQQGKNESKIRGVQEDFTLFGVGCSFSDNQEESHMRTQIMDQAGKGWCMAGALSETTLENENKHTPANDLFASNKKKDSIIDNEMFVHNSNKASRCNNGKRKSLVDHLIPTARTKTKNK